MGKFNQVYLAGFDIRVWGCPVDLEPDPCQETELDKGVRNWWAIRSFCS